MQGDAPEGGQWNFDPDNRGAFGAAGPGAVPPRAMFPPDALTREVITLVEERFAEPSGPAGRLCLAGDARAGAGQALQRFIAERLPLFGRYQDAMWPGEPWLYHAHLAAALNLKLLNPREVVAAAVAAYRAGAAPLASVEGFVRQILGWREYVRGIYWTRMPGYAGAATRWMRARTCRPGTGPAPPTWPACATRWRRRWRTDMPTTSSA